jgi:hypothetical protein
MGVLPLFFGFLLGAAIGTVATASNGAELRKEAKSWVGRKRWRHYFERRTWNLSELLTAALDLLQIEILFILVCFWVAGLLWTILLTPSWDHNSHVQYILGSLVGTATAPWIWLHFSATLDPAKKPAGATEDGGAQLQRYKFMSYMLGAALLAAVLQHYLPALLPRANKIEVAGLALNFTPAGNERGSKVLQTGQQAGGALGATTSRLATATTLAHLVTTGHEESKPWKKKIELQDIRPDMKGFDGLSVMDRDRVYIAYFYHERSARIGNSTLPPKPENLDEYVKAAKLDFSDEPDRKFLAGLADLSWCISLYAENLRDFRLFLVDSQPFLRTLLVDVAAKWVKRDKDAPASPQTPDSAADPLNLRAAETLANDVSQALHKALVIKDDQCPKSTGPKGQTTNSLTEKTIDVKAIGKTPYPAYLIAHYLAAVDSVESGVLVLRDWLFYQQGQVGPLQRGPEQNWYAIRAMLASSQLPYRFGSVSPTHRAQVQFQQETTDRFAAMLGIRGAQSWRAMCRRLDSGGLHARIGRYLAWTYADERNYLFELLGLEDFGLPAPGEEALISTRISPATYLEEAEAILENTDCFAGVPAFTEHYLNLTGQYSLNIAQLRYAVRASTQGDERAAITRRIRADLERAKQLQASRDPANVLDLLRQGDQFEPQRARLARFPALDNDAGKD